MGILGRGALSAAGHAAPGTGPVAALFWRRVSVTVRQKLRQKLRFVGRHLAALLNLARLPPELISARHHPLLLTHHRALLMAERLGVTAVFMSVSTIAWIPIDFFLFQADWSLVAPLAAARVVAGALFLAIAGFKLRSDTARDVIESLALVVAVGVVFFLFAHRIIGDGEAGHVGGAGHAQYVLMPIALVAGIAIFPLTLREVLLLSVLPLAVVLIEVLHGDGGTIFSQASAAVLLMCAVGIAAAACSLSQLKLFASLHRESTIDHLTGALSRRAGAELLSLMSASCKKGSKPLSLAFFDLDNFKLVNDRYGHEAGDEVLKQAAARLKGTGLRGNGLIRWGGEEFVLVLPGTDADDAVNIVARLGRSLGLRPDGSTQTVSIGLAECGADQIKSWKQLVETADQRMYLAKKAGRDRLLGPASVVRQLAGGT